MQRRSSDENSVCPSVKCMDCDKTEEMSVQIFISFNRTFSLGVIAKALRANIGSISAISLQWGPVDQKF